MLWYDASIATCNNVHLHMSWAVWNQKLSGVWDVAYASKRFMNPGPTLASLWMTACMARMGSVVAGRLIPQCVINFGRNRYETCDFGPLKWNYLFQYARKICSEGFKMDSRRRLRRRGTNHPRYEYPDREARVLLCFCAFAVLNTCHCPRGPTRSQMDVASLAILTAKLMM